MNTHLAAWFVIAGLMLTPATAWGANYSSNGDGTVTDFDTGLMWIQDRNGTSNWVTALAVCESLELAGYTDWRLPNIKELQTIIDSSRTFPAWDVMYFEGSYVDYGDWSSTTMARYPSKVWKVNFRSGETYGSGKGGTGYTRCVRGGL